MKSTGLSCLLACALCAYGAGCSSKNSDNGGSTNSGGSGGSSSTGDAGTAFMPPDDPTPVNPDCPQNDIGPTSGPYAQKGACCYRTSNKLRIDKSADKRTIEYRTNYFMLVNMPTTVDPTVVGPTTIQRFDNEEQDILFRFVEPQSGGDVTSGKGSVTIGAGRYNCDGTYSFYSDKAAPSSGGDPGRWNVPTLPATVDPSKTDKNRFKVGYKDALPLKNKAVALPYLGAAPDYALDWEGWSQGFDFITMPSGDDNLDCVGSRSGTDWKPAAKTVAFGPLKLNNTSKITALAGMSFCQLMAFGSSASNPPDCLATPRCNVGDSGCAWKRLPDSLCPETDGEKAAWGCHLGSDINKDTNTGMTLNCSNDAPSNINPDNGGPEGQCCDPLGNNTNNLPACNAWAQIQDVVAAGVYITDSLANELQQSCHGK